jgi:hypothetical protein
MDTKLTAVCMPSATKRRLTKRSVPRRQSPHFEVYFRVSGNMITSCEGNMVTMSQSYLD